MKNKTSIMTELSEAQEVLEEFDLRTTDPIYKCRTCGNDNLLYDVDMHKNWCPLCDDFSDIHGDERRKTATGMVKDTRTGFVEEPVTRKRDKFDKNLGSNKDA